LLIQNFIKFVLSKFSVNLLSNPFVQAGKDIIMSF